MAQRILICLIAMAAAAQQETPQASSGAVFRSTTRLVQVSVVAQDKRGQPVRDLRQDEFQVFEDGSPRQIRLFLAEPEKAGPASEPMAPGVFTNQIANSRSGYSVILIDSLNTDFGDPSESGSANARVYALRALHSIPPDESIAIYAMKRKPEVVCEFTSDRDRLERQLERWKPGVDTPGLSGAIFASPSSGPFASHATPTSDGEAADTDSAISGPRLDARQRAPISSIQLDLLADHLAGVPGRKNLIWLSNRFGIGPGTLRKFNDAGVAIYPVNADGATSRLDPLKYFLKDIAAQTGGVAYDMRNDIDVAIREAIDDGRAGYTLGFYAPDDGGVARVHRLSIRVTRPGVALRYRTSYRTDVSKPVSAGGNAGLLEALDRPVDATAVPIRASILRRNGGLDVKAVVDVGSLELPLVGERWTGIIAFAARFTAADGRPAGKALVRSMPLRLRPVPQGLGLRDEFVIPAGAVEFKLLFANPAAGKLGTLSIPLAEVPK